MTTVPKPPDPPGVDVSVWDVWEGDRIVRDGRLVTVTLRTTGFADLELTQALGDLSLYWESTERDADGIPVLSGVTHILAAEDETVRLVERPTVVDLPGVAR